MRKRVATLKATRLAEAVLPMPEQQVLTGRMALMDIPAQAVVVAQEVQL
jgi:hypothetical protein